MLFWIREVAGWLLVIFSLFLVWMGIGYISNVTAPRIVEAGVVMFTAMAIMRAGILLIRISTAARICLKEQTPKQP